MRGGGHVLVGHGGHLLDVGPSGEHLRPTVDDHGTHLGPVPGRGSADPPGGSQDLVLHREVQRVHRRAVQPQRGDPLLELDPAQAALDDHIHCPHPCPVPGPAIDERTTAARGPRGPSPRARQGARRGALPRAHATELRLRAGHARDRRWTGPTLGRLRPVHGAVERPRPSADGPASVNAAALPVERLAEAWPGTWNPLGVTLRRGRQRRHLGRGRPQWTSALFDENGRETRYELAETTFQHLPRVRRRESGR